MFNTWCNDGMTGFLYLHLQVWTN